MRHAGPVEAQHAAVAVSHRDTVAFLRSSAENADETKCLRRSKEVLRGTAQ